MENNIVEKIIKLKKEKNAVILAHNYVTMDVQNVADFVGDSLALAQKAKTVEADLIVFCGVRFMGETAKLLNPETKVVLANKNAGCPMADMITADQLKDFKAEHPNSTVMCYVNSSIEVKAESDICCTSSNAVKIAKSVPEDKTILFVPDKNLGTYVAQQTKHKVIVWDGFCPVHNNNFSKIDVEKVRKNFPDYKLLVHPESLPEVFNKADIVGSTKGMADYSEENNKIIIGTEVGLLRQLEAKYPEKKFAALSEKAICVNMKKNTLKDVLNSLENETDEIIIDAEIAKRALKSIEAMLELS